MSKLTAIRKQIAALEAEAERITKQEMAGAIAKVKEIMSTFGLTIEHLQSAVTGKVRTAAKKAKPKAKRAGGGVAKYADPKTGKTWSGFGRAPAWIAGARSRDAFLVDKSAAKAPEAAGKAKAASKKPAARKAPAKKVAKTAARKAVAVAKKAAPAVALKKKPSARKASTKVAAGKAARKTAAPASAAGASAAAGGGAAAAA